MVIRFKRSSRWLLCILQISLFSGSIELKAVTIESQKAFPTYGLLPKEETGAAKFIADHPEYDGRGVTVAVFDTGVDPGAPGLQLTSDGRPKIIDLIDGSGSGDVDTSAVREAKEGTIHGLSKKKLRLASSWSNPTGKYYVGLKRGYELFPPALVTRLKEKRREKWDVDQRALVTKLQCEILAWNDAHPKPTDDETKQKKDLDVRLEQLQELEKEYDDPGPLYDCIVFHDGKAWRAAIDTDEDGDFGNETLLTNFRDERKYATFGKEDLLNFALNIYDEGKLLSIVVDSGMHGTHVAGIVGAYFPGQPELSGVAPGAQIVAVKIGDTRLGSMETSTGFVRGLAAVRRHHCDLINLSYGESTTMPNAGRLMDLLSEIVNEKGVIFIAAAGNAGPALSTAGAPGGTTSALIGVGAYVSPEMMLAGYSMRQKLPETQFTWSSRGPTYDGALGVSISAPGGAISPVPTWVLQRNQMANGTSMAAPNASGSVALLLSALKANKIPCTPATMRRALENTARPIENVEVFAQGHGLIQVEPAFQYLKETARIPAAAEPRYEVSIPQRQNARGVLLREAEEVGRLLETSVRVAAVFPKESDNHLKVEFEKRFRLESTVRWVEVPEFLLLAYNGRSFDIKVDPTRLNEGCHYAEVRGYDVDAPELGPVFRLPVTVIKPHSWDSRESSVWRERLTLRPAKLERRFLSVPNGAAWAELTVRADSLDSDRRLVVHALQTLPGKRFTQTGQQRYLTMHTKGKETVRFPVTAGRTLELCVGQFWSSLGEGEFEFTLDFHGLASSRDEIFLDQAARLEHVEVTAAQEAIQLAPRAKLTALRRHLRPTKAEIRPSHDERDALDEGRQVNELILTYSFKQTEAGSVTPRIYGLDGRLYDAEFGSQLWMLFDSAKRLIKVDDTWDSKSVKLEEGDYVLRLQLRHDDPSELEKLKELPIALDCEFSSSIALDCYGNPDQALIAGKKLNDRRLEKSERAVFYIGAPTKDKMPKSAKPGDLLVGTIKYENAEGAHEYPLLCSVAATASADGESKKEKKGSDLSKQLREEKRDLQLAQLDRLSSEKDDKLFNEVVEEVLHDYPDNLAVLVKQLHRTDNDDRDERLRSVVAAADKVIDRIDRHALAAYFGVRNNAEDPKAKELQEQMDREKESLIDALYRKGRALAFMELPSEDDDDEPTSVSQAAATEEPPFDHPTVEKLFEENFAELKQWADTTDDKNFLLHIRRDWRHQHFGEVLKVIQQKLKKPKTEPKLYRKRMQVFKDLGWTNWEEYERKWLLIRFPKDYPKF